MTAGAFRKGGAGTSIHLATGVCSLGPLLVAQSDPGICAPLLPDDPETLLENPKAQFPKPTLLRRAQAPARPLQQVPELVDAPAIDRQRVRHGKSAPARRDTCRRRLPTTTEP